MAMFMAEIFEKLATRGPVALMARALMERALEPEGIDQLFADNAERQYLKELTFSSMVDLMAAVVCGKHPSVRSAHLNMRAQLPVSLTALYDKLNGLEVTTIEALVRYSADRLEPIVTQLNEKAERWLPGYRVKVLDGNHIAATDRRLGVLRGCAAGPLPGQALVVFQPETGLSTQMVACEDGHAQERSLLAPVLAAVAPGDLYITDRNFCTLGFLLGVADRGGCFVVRQHANLPVESAGTLRQVGQTETGTVFEQRITLRQEDRLLSARRIVIRLEKATRDGDAELAIITNLPETDASAVIVANLYRRRWTIESMFARIERNLKSELPSLGYPGAALFAFAVALVANNIFAVVEAAMNAAKAAHPDPKVAKMQLSHFALVEAIRSVHGGIALFVEDSAWRPFQTLAHGEMARLLIEWATNSDWRCYEKAVVRPRKPSSKRTGFTDTPHVSTARLLGRVESRDRLIK